MVEGFSVEESGFLKWAMKTIQDFIDEEMTWRQYLLVLVVLEYLLETELYRYILDDELLFYIKSIDREYRNREVSV